jgi:hypothetical protein
MFARDVELNTTREAVPIVPLGFGFSPMRKEDGVRAQHKENKVLC